LLNYGHLTRLDINRLQGDIGGSCPSTYSYAAQIDEVDN
jgi:hypothetical protein